MTAVESFRELADHLTRPLLLMEPSGRVVAENAEARRFLGADLVGEDLTERVSQPERLRHYLSLCSGSGDRLPGSLRLRGSPEDEVLRCDCSVLPTTLPGPPLLLFQLRRRPEAAERFVVLNDQIERLHREIRRREEAERERESLLEQERAARADAEEASRLKDEFLATVSHELRTPLNAIKGWVHLLRSRPPDTELLARGLGIIEKNVDLQTQLVEDLLDVSRIITGRIRLLVQPVDLADVVRDSVEAVRPAAEAKGIRLQVVTESSGCTIHGDKDRLVQVIWNLLSNSVKFTPKGGRIQVLLRRVNSHVEIVVSDTGEGISADVLPYVFDRFRQADASTTRRHGGLGLGLAIVRHLVELHGGLVLAESPGAGRGATFTVSLPVPLFERPGAVLAGAQGPEVQTVTAGVRAEAPEVSLAGLRVLLVEDHEDSRQLLRTILEEAGAAVTAVAGAAEALEAFESERPDAMVSDIEMPGEDGYTLVRKVRDLEKREETPRTPAVAVTAYASGEHRLRALRAGFQSFVPKPVHPTELLTVVASITGRL